LLLQNNRPSVKFSFKYTGPCGSINKWKLGDWPKTDTNPSGPIFARTQKPFDKLGTVDSDEIINH
jgi:hypothetical protein